MKSSVKIKCDCHAGYVCQHMPFKFRKIADIPERYEAVKKKLGDEYESTRCHKGPLVIISKVSVSA